MTGPRKTFGEIAEDVRGISSRSKAEQDMRDRNSVSAMMNYRHAAHHFTQGRESDDAANAREIADRIDKSSRSGSSKGCCIIL